MELIRLEPRKELLSHRKYKYTYKNKLLSATDIAQLANTSFKLTSSRLEKGWTVQECIDGSRKKKKLMFEFRCKCCGMEITTRSNTQRFCDVLCRDTFKKYPHEYGQWWQE